MKKYLIILIFIILFIALIFYIIEKNYNIELNENEITNSIQNGLGEELDISLIEKYIISNSNTQIIFFEYSKNNGYALFKKNYFNNKLKLVSLNKNLLDEYIGIIYTNKGNYIILSGNYNEKVDSFLVKEGDSEYLFKVENIAGEFGNLYITLETIPRSITEKMLENPILYNENNEQVY